MNEVLEHPAREATCTGVREWPLTVVRAFDLENGRRRLSLVSEIDGFRYCPGQPLALRASTARGEADLTCFEVHHFDDLEQRLDLDFDLAAADAARAWLLGAALGHAVIAETAEG